MPKTFASSLQGEIEALASGFSGEVAVAATDLSSGQRFLHNANQVLPTASVIKVPILLEVLRQCEIDALSLDERGGVPATSHVGGSGVLKLFDNGVELSLREAATLMIAVSDNTATNICVDSVGGVESVNRLCADLGLGDTRLHNRVEFDVIGDDVRRLGESTAADLDMMMGMIARGEAISSWVSTEAERILGTQQYLDQFARYYALNPYAAELGQTATLQVASKTGFFTGTRVDSGIVRFGVGGGFTYAVMNHGSEDLTFAPEAEGAVLNGLIGHRILSHWWPGDALPVPVLRSRYVNAPATRY